MKRTQTTKYLYSRFVTNPFELVNHNIGSPNLIESTSLSLNEREPTIQIIEINSDENESDKKRPDVRTNDKLENNNINVKATGINPTNYEDYIFDTENMYNNEYLNDTFNSHCDGDDRFYHNQNKFPTIINNIETDTSSGTDESDDIEIIQFENTLDKLLWKFNNSYKIFECDNISKEEQYKWMYSANDDKISRGDDYELSSFTSNDTNSSNTDDDDTSKRRIRVATPMFNFIPKLNLPTSPLPTLTEVAEPTKQSVSDVTENSSNCSNFLRKSVNSWLDDGSDEDKHNNRNKTPNLQSKLSTLSQRERRKCQLANTVDKNLENVDQINFYCEPEVTIHKNSRSVSSVRDTERDFSATDNINNNKDEFNVENYEKDNLNRLHTLITSHTKVITDQIEKLEGNWINNGEELTDAYDCDLNTIDSAGTKKLSNDDNSEDSANISRIPATYNMPSLHLSFETDCEEDKKSCLKRAFKFILCCK